MFLRDALHPTVTPKSEETFEDLNLAEEIGGNTGQIQTVSVSFLVE